MNVDLDDLKKHKYPLRSRTVVKLLDAFRDINAMDIQEFIDKVRNGEIKGTLLNKKIIKKIKRVKRFDQLDKHSASIVIAYLSNPLKDKFDYTPKVPSFLTHLLSLFLFDFPLLLHEKVFLCSTNHKLSKEAFYERLCKKFARLEMNVGSIIPAYKTKHGLQFYRIAAKLITVDGQVSYTLLPLTKDSKDIEPIRVFKGSGMQLSSMDFLSYLITDFERNLESRAFNSGKKFERHIRALGKVQTEIGFSIGAAIVQYRAAFMDGIKTIYLYNSPGVPRFVIDQFNKRFLNRSFNVNIRRTKGDLVDLVGSCLLGYKASKSVNINFLKFVPQEKEGLVHTQVFLDKKRLYAITGGDLNYELNNFNRSPLEAIRWVVGGFLLSPFFLLIRHINRVNFYTRTQKESGLFIEDMNSKKYRIKHVIAQRTLIERYISS